MRNVIGDEQGGIYHALIGTLLITLAAAVISVPIGAADRDLPRRVRREVAGWRRSITLPRRRDDRHPVDRGRPVRAARCSCCSSGPASGSGFGGSVALSLLMIPIVVRSSEEMLRLVPDDLREASYALGVPKWRTIVRVVLPTALGGIITGVDAGDRPRDRRDRAAAGHRRRRPTRDELQPVHGPDDHAAGLHLLPVHAARASTPRSRARCAPGARALVLIVIVMVLNLLARVIGKIFAPKTALSAGSKGTPWPRASTSPTSTSTTATSSPWRAST